MRRKFFWPFLILFVSLSTGILVWSGTNVLLRPIVVFLFMLIIPGLALTRLMRIKDFLTELIIAIAISLGISILMSEVMVFAHLWSPAVGFIILVSISLIGAALQLNKALTQDRHTEAG